VPFQKPPGRLRGQQVEERVLVGPEHGPEYGAGSDLRVVAWNFALQMDAMKMAMTILRLFGRRRSSLVELVL
jgi:hypothetical protein